MKGDLKPADKSRLVEEAEKILDAVKTSDGFAKNTSQLRNLVQITQRESEVPVLRNFIRYQTGRKATKKFWLLIHFEVLRVLEGIGKDFPETEQRRVAIQSFFGYLVRHYVFLTEGS